MPESKIFVAATVLLEVAERISQLLPDFKFLSKTAQENFHIKLLFTRKVKDLAILILTFETLRFEPYEISIKAVNGFTKTKNWLAAYYVNFQSSPSFKFYDQTER